MVIQLPHKEQGSILLYLLFDTTSIVLVRNVLRFMSFSRSSESQTWFHNLYRPVDEGLEAVAASLWGTTAT